MSAGDCQAAAARWALDLLARPPGQVLILDTETTALDGYLVELAVTDTRGRVVFGSRLYPGAVDVDPDAEAVHGLFAKQLAEGGFPSFNSVAGVLASVLDGRTVVTYNAAFDAGVLRRELTRTAASTGRDYPAAYARDWLARSEWQCAMLRYAEFVGEWNDYHGNYRWQPLAGGDHSALGDCRATLAVLRQMAACAEVAGAIA